MGTWADEISIAECLQLCGIPCQAPEFTHSVNKYLLSIYYFPGTVLTGETKGAGNVWW